jgi:hypothetical protein
MRNHCMNLHVNYRGKRGVNNQEKTQRSHYKLLREKDHSLRRKRKMLILNENLALVVYTPKKTIAEMHLEENRCVEERNNC